MQQTGPEQKYSHNLIWALPPPLAGWLQAAEMIPKYRLALGNSPAGLPLQDETVTSFAIELASQSYTKLGNMLPACGCANAFEWEFNSIQYDTAPVYCGLRW